MKAALLSCLLPGAGQLYAGRRARGLVLMLGLPLQAGLFYAVELPLLSLWLIPIWLWNIADAYALARGRPLSPALPILVVVLLDFAAGWTLTEIRLGELARGLPRMAPILRGLLQPDLFERAHATQRATANITLRAVRGVADGGKAAAGGFFRAASTEARRWVNLSPGPSPKRGGVPDSMASWQKAKWTVYWDGDRKEKLPLPASGRGLGGEVNSSGGLLLCAAAVPAVHLEPAVAAPGERVRVEGRGFWPGEAGRIVLVASGTEVLARVKTGPEGALATTVTLPQRPPGRYWIDVLVERPLPRWQATETLRRCARAMLDTIFLALMGTALAIPASFLLAFCGARNLTARTAGGRLLYGAARGTMNLLRSVEVLIIALMMVVVVGIGPFAGVLALAIHGVGALGKLYSEAIESIDPGPIEAITATGAHPLQVVVYGVIPQVVPQFVAFTIYRWDINVRMATVIGLVGGGGIGFILADYINLFRWPQAGTALWLIALIVIAMDYASAVLRERLR
jgi:phosphonate transport system permease protein